MRITLLLLALAASLILPSDRASATCSCFFRQPPPPTSQDSSLTRDPGYSPSAAVFIVRDGLKTILTVETAYKGPRVPLSMILPVPTNIGRDQVRTVNGSLFRNLDRRTAPRVQHLFPACPQPRRARAMSATADGLGSSGGGGGGGPEEAEEPPVEVVDEWALDEYDIAVLDANQSTGLMDFLRARGLELPAQAEPVLRAYIETGHRFVFATVDPARAHVLADDTMVLSPLQLEYESADLRVPVRLGTLNSPGEQEVLLYVLSRDGRYEVANRPVAVAPTDVRLQSSAAGSVAELYASLMDEQFRQSPGAAVTEFAHNLGRRVGYNNVREFGLSDEARREGRWTLTRLRHRYGKELSDDLVLRPAEAPLRMTRRYRIPGARVWAPRGESGFHVRFVVEHNRCMNADQQRRLVRRFATAESMWSQGDRPWPGELLRDDVPSLSITAGSSAPPNWPPPQVAITPPVAPAAVVEPTPSQAAQAQPANSEINPATPVTPVQPAPITQRAAPVEPTGGFCSVSGVPSPWAIAAGLAALAVVFGRRRRR